MGESVTEGHGKSRRLIQYLQLVVASSATLPGGVQMQQISVTVPPGVAPLSQIIVQTPGGSQVSVVVPAGCQPGTTFQVAVPQPPIVQAVMVPESNVTVIDKGGWSVSGYTPAKSMVVAMGVPYDSTGDGILDSTGYDTTGDGKVDAIDTTGDGRVNVVIGNSNVTPGSRIEESNV